MPPEPIPLTKQPAAPKSMFREVGSTGLKQQAGTIFEEYQHALSGLRGVAVYTEMGNSAVIGSILYTIEQMIQAIEWKINPFSDEAKDEEPKKFIEEAFEDMSYSWTDTLSDICTMFKYGWCLPPDQMILRGDGTPVPIGQIKLGDEVLTGKGRARRVTKIYQRPFDGELISIKARGYPHRVRLTPEHELPTLAGWKKAGDLTTEDLVIRPRPKLRDGGEYLDGWLVGLFLAEGSRTHKNTVLFSLHRNEGDEVKKHVENWVARNGITWDHSDHGGARKPGVQVYYHRFLRASIVKITHQSFRALIDKWVKPSHRPKEKELSQLPLEREFSQGVWDGWWYGDGCRKMISGRFRAEGCSSSIGLVHQLMILGGSLGYPAAVWHDRLDRWNISGLAQRRMTRGWKPELMARIIQGQAGGLSVHHIAKMVGVARSTVQRWLKWQREPMLNGLQPQIGDEGIHHRIMSISRDQFTGTVYDLEIEEDHTFCAGPFTVSNCYMETVYKLRRGPDGDSPSKFTDGKISWRKWAIRGQDTLSRWDIDDNGGIRGMWQFANWPQMEEVFIPIEKALLFRTSTVKNNPEGFPMLRRSYRSFWYSKKFEEIEAIGIERDLAGLPTLTPPENLDIWNTKDPTMVAALAAAQRLVQGIRRGEKEGVVKPYGWVLELLSSGSRRQFDLSATIQRHETRIAMTCLADFIFLGQGSTGSWALADSKTKMFVLALGGFLRRIKEVVNRHAIPALLRLNKMDAARPPKLEHGDIETQDLTQLASYLTALSNIGCLSFPDQKLEDHLRLVADLPRQSEEPTVPEDWLATQRKPMDQLDPPAQPQGSIQPTPIIEQKRQEIRKALGELTEMLKAKGKINANQDHEQHGE